MIAKGQPNNGLKTDFLLRYSTDGILICIRSLDFCVCRDYFRSCPAVLIKASKITCPALSLPTIFLIFSLKPSNACPTSSPLFHPIENLKQPIAFIACHFISIENPIREENNEKNALSSKKKHANLYIKLKHASMIKYTPV